ncbi:hypothetical protein JHK85_006444 [Glycine max]|nr:hypothetical protein JHK85_006444 [Glycine max]
MATLRRKEDGLSGSHSSPIRLTYAEDALRTMSLHEVKLRDLMEAISEIEPGEVIFSQREILQAP